MESVPKKTLRPKPKAGKINLKRNQVELSNVKTFDEDNRVLNKKRRKSSYTKVLQERKRKSRVNKNKGFTPGIVYLGHIPNGFTQKGMREYFTQFGDVGRIRVACSRKTGRSKGYAFIEFKCDEVAKVVAETMNNYFMFEKLLKCVYIPKDKAHPLLFQGHRPHHELAYKKFVKEHNKTKDLKTQQKALETRVNKLENKKKKLAELGVKFNFSLENTDEVKKILEKRRNDEKEAAKLQSADQNLVKALQEDSVSSANSSASEDEDFSFSKMFSSGEMTDSSKYTLELDSSDEDISFNTPPNARKTIKKKEINNKWKIENTLDTSKINKYKSPKMNVNPFSIQPALNMAKKKNNTSINFGKKKGRKSSNNKTL